jgi:hypothetical protein
MTSLNLTRLYFLSGNNEMSQRRLNDLQDNLDLLYEKLGMYEEDLIKAIGAEKIALKLRIKRDILPDIRRYESEYWDLMPKEALVISDEEAEATLVKVNEAVKSIERVDAAEYPPGMMELLQEIRNQLNDTGQSAAAKLKVTLPIVPMLASYELEMDTEGMLSGIWQTIRKRFKR